MPATSRRRRCDSTKSTRDGSSFLLEKRKEPKENRQRVQSGLHCRGSNDGSIRGTDVCTGGMNRARRFRSRKKGTVKRKEPKENRQRVQSGLRCRGSNDGSKRGTVVCTDGMNGARRFRSRKKGTERKPSAVQSGLRCRGSNDGSKRGTDVCTGGMNGARRFRSRKKESSKERNRKKRLRARSGFQFALFTRKPFPPKGPCGQRLAARPQR